MARETAAEVLDKLRAMDDEHFSAMKLLLGTSFDLLDELLALHDAFFAAAHKTIGALEPEQIGAILYSLLWMRHEAVAGGLASMRGHIADASVFNRRTLELAAFVVEMFGKPESAKRWAEIGLSVGAQKRYLSRFPAFELVRKHLTKELQDYYAEDCYDEHPSRFGISHRSGVSEDGNLYLGYFDLSETDGNQVFFVMRFLNMFLRHSKSLEHLTTVFYPKGMFDSDGWLESYRPFILKFRAERARWQPIIDAHLEADDQSDS